TPTPTAPHPSSPPLANPPHIPPCAEYPAAPPVPRSSTREQFPRSPAVAPPDHKYYESNCSPRLRQTSHRQTASSAYPRCAPRRAAPLLRSAHSPSSPCCDCPPNPAATRGPARLPCHSAIAALLQVKAIPDHIPHPTPSHYHLNGGHPAADHALLACQPCC